MTLFAQLKETHVASRKERNKNASLILGLLIGDIQTAQLSAPKPDNKGNLPVRGEDNLPNDQEIQQMIRKLIEANVQAIKVKKERGDEGDVIDLQDQNFVLEKFLPKQLSKEELTQVIYTQKHLRGCETIGDLQKFLRENFNGQFDGKMATEIFKEISAG